MMLTMMDGGWRSDSGIKYGLRLLLTILLMTASVCCRDADSCHSKLNNCTVMVQPYLRNVQYMFPTTTTDIEEMCKIWSQFVDCVRRFVVHCFSDERRSQFNVGQYHESLSRESLTMKSITVAMGAAVENAVDTVHAICSSEPVQREYLNNADCFRRVSVDKCGSFYGQLVDHVSNPKSHDDHICCSYSQFRDCVHDPLLRECGNRARNLMDHSMGFLISKCADKSHFRMDRLCPTPPPIVDEFDANAQRVRETEGQDHRDRSFDHRTGGTYDHHTASEQESHTSSASGLDSCVYETLAVLSSLFIQISISSAVLLL